MDKLFFTSRETHVSWRIVVATSTVIIIVAATADFSVLSDLQVFGAELPTTTYKMLLTALLGISSLSLIKNFYFDAMQRIWSQMDVITNVDTNDDLKTKNRKLDFLERLQKKHDIISLVWVLFFPVILAFTALKFLLK